jgi:hypothetical protein
MDHKGRPNKMKKIWLVVTGTMEFESTSQKQFGMECHHPN